jgi:hypothetical protein
LIFISIGLASFLVATMRQFFSKLRNAPRLLHQQEVPNYKFSKFSTSLLFFLGGFLALLQQVLFNRFRLFITLSSLLVLAC